MEKKFYQSPEFERLSKEWEKKLEQEGLPDLDSPKVQRTVIRYRNQDLDWIESKALYFQALQECVSRASFDNEVDKIVMTLKAEGAKIKEICEALLAAGKKRYRRTVRLIIRKYEDRWGIRSWKPEDLKYDWLKRQRTR